MLGDFAQIFSRVQQLWALFRTAILNWFYILRSETTKIYNCLYKPRNRSHSETSSLYTTVNLLVTFSPYYIQALCFMKNYFISFLPLTQSFASVGLSQL